MFRDVPECSGMFRDVPCSGFYRRPVTIYGDANRRNIHLPLFTDSKGDSCFSIYQISWIKMKKSKFL